MWVFCLFHRRIYFNFIRRYTCTGNQNETTGLGLGVGPRMAEVCPWAVSTIRPSVRILFSWQARTISTVVTRAGVKPLETSYNYLPRVSRAKAAVLSDMHERKTVFPPDLSHLHKQGIVLHTQGRDNDGLGYVDMAPHAGSG